MQFIVLNKEQYNDWLGTAMRFTRRRQEAEDLLHDALLSAVEARRMDLNSGSNRAWFAGVIRNQAAMTARGAGRRKRRESLPRPRPQSVLAAVDEPDHGSLRRLSHAARIVAILAVHGLNRDEIASVLDLSPAALRQRLSTLRRHWKNVPDQERQELLRPIRGPASFNHNLEHGLIRRSLIAFLHDLPGVGTHDPDGHLIIFGKASPSQIRTRRQQSGKKES